MLPVAYYIAKVIICSVILYGYYWLMLRNKNFHGYNRFYLLAATGLSLLLPLVRIDLWNSNEPEQGTVIGLLRAVSTGDEYMQAVVIRSNAPSWTPEQLYPFAYLIVSLVMLIVLLHGLTRIALLLRRNPVQEIGDISFINSNAKGTPFSFFKYIFWNEKIDMDSESGKQIFRHELAHIRERHSFDKLFINIVLIFFWINPVFWLIRKELSMIHEFIADRRAIDNNDTAAFAAMILQATYPQHRFQLSSSFFYSPIKRRLLMLTRNNSKAGYIGRLLVLPLAAMLFAAFTLRNKQAAMLTITPSETSLYPDREVKTYFTADTVPARLPTEAEWDRAAGKKPAITTTDGKTTIVIDQKRVDNPKVLYVIDGKRIGSGKIAEVKLNELVTPEKILEVRIFKDEAAIKKYGEDGKYGVIEINTKPEMKEVQIAGLQAPVEEVVVTGYPSKVNVTGTQVEKPVALTLADVKEEVVVTGYPSKHNVAGTQLEKPVALTLAPVKEEVVVTGYRSVRLRKAEGQQIATTLAPVKEEVVVSGYPTVRLRKVEGEQLTTTTALAGKVEEVLVTGYPVFTKVEIEARFPGGYDAWKAYLTKNIRSSLPVEEGWKAGTYNVIVQFIVSSDGTVSNVTTLNYQGTRTAQHCIDIIKNGPKWEPAMQNGKAVSSYRKQPVTFVIAEK